MFDPSARNSSTKFQHNIRYGIGEEAKWQKTQKLQKKKKIEQIAVPPVQMKVWGDSSVPMQFQSNWSSAFGGDFSQISPQKDKKIIKNPKITGP